VGRRGILARRGEVRAGCGGVVVRAEATAEASATVRLCGDARSRRPDGRGSGGRDRGQSQRRRPYVRAGLVWPTKAGQKRRLDPGGASQRDATPGGVACLRATAGYDRRRAAAEPNGHGRTRLPPSAEPDRCVEEFRAGQAGRHRSTCRLPALPSGRSGARGRRSGETRRCASVPSWTVPRREVCPDVGRWTPRSGDRAPGVTTEPNGPFAFGRRPVSGEVRPCPVHVPRRGAMSGRAGVPRGGAGCVRGANLWRGQPQRRCRCETEPAGLREERSVKRLRKPEDAAQPGEANPVQVASRCLRRHRGHEPHEGKLREQRSGAGQTLKRSPSPREDETVWQTPGPDAGGNTSETGSQDQGHRGGA